ncbi:hypothetical protein VTK73DRAFT_3774 [Phialemonium thermophilum]|uniref:Transposase n=1 Tax=Phialemonium thermophilum TaxID=223376 RepID=A0ABR3VF23_9PEZI
MAASRDRSLAEFLQPFHVDAHLVRRLSRELAATFRHLSAESLDQFLPTPISESILRHVASKSRGRYLAIDM